MAESLVKGNKLLLQSPELNLSPGLYGQCLDIMGTWG